jgi:undecaprenyl-diphosphatase
MQEFLSSVLFAVVQGFTEFLPVSSSGHLVLLGYFYPDVHSLTFDVLLHLGTLLSVIVFFRKDILSLAKEKRSLLVSIIVATIPAGIVGIFLKDQLERLFDAKHLLFLSLSFVITSCLVFFAGRKILAEGSTEEGKDIDIRKALIIGLFQALAIVPGISRAGATISSAILLGVPPKKAFVFSFLLSLPAVAGAAVLEMTGMKTGAIKIAEMNMVFSFITAFLTGLAALYTLRSAIVNKHYRCFSYYTVFLAAFTLMLFLKG